MSRTTLTNHVFNSKIRAKKKNLAAKPAASRAGDDTATWIGSQVKPLQEIQPSDGLVRDAIAVAASHPRPAAAVTISSTPTRETTPATQLSESSPAQSPPRAPETTDTYRPSVPRNEERASRLARDAGYISETPSPGPPLQARSRAPSSMEEESLAASPTPPRSQAGDRARESSIPGIEALTLGDRSSLASTTSEKSVRDRSPIPAGEVDPDYLPSSPVSLQGEDEEEEPEAPAIRAFGPDSQPATPTSSRNTSDVFSPFEPTASHMSLLSSPGGSDTSRRQMATAPQPLVDHDQGHAYDFLTAICTPYSTKKRGVRILSDQPALPLSLTKSEAFLARFPITIRRLFDIDSAWFAPLNLGVIRARNDFRLTFLPRFSLHISTDQVVQPHGLSLERTRHVLLGSFQTGPVRFSAFVLFPSSAGSPRSKTSASPNTLSHERLREFYDEIIFPAIREAIKDPFHQEVPQSFYMVYAMSRSSQEKPATGQRSADDDGRSSYQLSCTVPAKDLARFWSLVVKKANLLRVPTKRGENVAYFKNLRLLF
ncbi:hypothetical protein MGU_10219 [Metarhizium guizhouense ARSEF 977]|uniref:Uncharacterized protein n=1 Tax=Metarhizium guizhouense (strain ARSEF 977) TaxID=1276136 RepID=A0A0B4G728_METGA|nr:hypothetical protein MGU_10219 [Metarhizium guizhouense ARSEF 977]